MGKSDLIGNAIGALAQQDHVIFYYAASALIITVIVMTIITVIYMFSRNTHLLKEKFNG